MSAEKEDLNPDWMTQIIRFLNLIILKTIQNSPDDFDEMADILNELKSGVFAVMESMEKDNMTKNDFKEIFNIGKLLRTHHAFFKTFVPIVITYQCLNLN